MTSSASPLQYWAKLYHNTQWDHFRELIQAFHFKLTAAKIDMQHDTKSMEPGAFSMQEVQRESINQDLYSASGFLLLDIH